MWGRLFQERKQEEETSVSNRARALKLSYLNEGGGEVHEAAVGLIPSRTLEENLFLAFSGF